MMSFPRKRESAKIASMYGHQNSKNHYRSARDGYRAPRGILRAAACIGFALLVALPSVALGANFSDVPDTHAHAEAILILKDAGLVGGYGDGTFLPDKSVTRAEALAMIMKAAGIISEKTGKKMPFSDVKEGDWFFPMVQKAVSLKKLKGYEDKTFRPENLITLPEALALTLSFFNIDVKPVIVEPVIYAGLDANDWSSKFTQYAKNNFLIEPDEGGRVDPVKPLTRGEIAEILYRMRLVSQTKKPFDITKNWILTEHLDNFWKLRHPEDWEIFQGQKNSVIWKRDSAQIFFTRVWPASVRLSISVFENSERQTPAQYFGNLKNTYQKSYPNVKVFFAEMALSGRPSLKINIPERRLLDTIISLPNGQFLVMYGDYGEAPQAEFLKKKLELVIASYQFVERPPEPPKPVIPLEQRMETLRENILVADKWKDLTPLFPDKRLIHTDAIGIGTGPVDYYYSKEANHTIKLERNSGTVLNIRENETFAF